MRNSWRGARSSSAPSRIGAMSSPTGRCMHAGWLGRGSWGRTLAGRAGRGLRDGTFGTTADCPPFDDDLAHAVENHRFEPLTQLCWRGTELDFSTLDSLLATLTAPPPGPGLVRGNDATDLETLA